MTSRPATTDWLDTSIGNAGVRKLDDRGLMPLASARKQVRAATEFRKGSGRMVDGALGGPVQLAGGACFPVTSWADIGPTMVSGMLSARGLVVLACWVAFLAIVTVMTRRARAGVVVRRARRASRLLALQYALFFTMLVHSLVFWRPVVAVTTSWVGAAMLAVGFALYARAIRVFGRGYNPLVSMRHDQQLCAEGPFRRIRHPLYASQMVMMAGTGLALQHFDFLGLPLVFALMVQAARAEEDLLGRALPGYPAYRARTWMFVPYVW